VSRILDIIETNYFILGSKMTVKTLPDLVPKKNKDFPSFQF